MATTTAATHTSQIMLQKFWCALLGLKFYTNTPARGNSAEKRKAQHSRRTQSNVGISGRQVHIQRCHVISGTEVVTKWDGRIITFSFFGGVLYMAKWLNYTVFLLSRITFCRVGALHYSLTSVQNSCPLPLVREVHVSFIHLSHCFLRNGPEVRSD